MQLAAAMADLPPPALADYFARRLDAVVERVEPLVPDAGGTTTAKVEGYGRPLRLWLRLADGGRRSCVFHTATVNEFGHDRPSDRALQQLLAAETFGLIPDHVRVLDVGAVQADGSLHSLLGAGEFFLVTDYAEGTPYAHDLRRLARGAPASRLDVERATALASWLARLHTRLPADEVKWRRSLRDVVGSGEGVLGLCDAYPADCPGVAPGLLLELERLVAGARWALKPRGARLSRIHGDFHPFNLVFRDGVEFTALDASRGCAGDPADDVTALAINYLFFAIEHPDRWEGCFSRLWRALWDTYLRESGDREVLASAPLFFAWRALVVCCPRFYPQLSGRAREALLGLAHRALVDGRLELEQADGLFR
jgi:hypothetical protein